MSSPIGARNSRPLLRPIAQRRDSDRKHIQAIEEIEAKPSVREHLLEILVRRRDDSHIDARRLRAPEPLDLLFLNDAQQFGLEFDRQFADLVEEDRPVVCRLKPTNSARDGSSEGPSFIATVSYRRSRSASRAMSP
jgi:hypothetical protein